MIDQFSNLIQLSKECCDFTTSVSEVDSLKEAVAKFDFSKSNLTNIQKEILFKDNNNSIIKQVIDQSSGILSPFGKELIFREFSKNPDFLFFLEFLSKYNESSPPKNFSQISKDLLDPLTYFFFVQHIFDSIPTIPFDMSSEQIALSDMIKYIIFHTKSLSLTENLEGLNKELLKVCQNTNLDLFQPIFQDCYLKSIVHKNRISKEVINSLPKNLLQQSDTDEALITKFSNESENYYSLISVVSSLIYYQNYLSNDDKNCFNPYNKFKSENFSDCKNRTVSLIEKFGELMNHGKRPIGFYSIRANVKWEKAFKGTRLSNAAFIEITYQSAKKSYEINTDEDSSFEIVLPAYSKSGDNATVSLLYVKEKFNDTLRKKVPQEGIGSLVSFSYPMKADGNKEASKGKSKNSGSTKSTGDFVVEFKRGDSALSNKCGTVTLSLKFFDFSNEASGEVLSNNIYLSKSGDNLSDDFQMVNFLEFLVSNMVGQWMTSTTKSGTMPIYPPQEAYIGLIEFSIRYSIPASTVFLMITRKLLDAWCHAESYLDALALMFITANVCMEYNNKRNKKQFMNNIEEKLYQYIFEFFAENIPIYLIHHISKAGLYQNHGLVPLLLLLSFIIPEEGIETYINQLIQASQKKNIHSITDNLQPITLEGDTNSDKMTKEVSNLFDFVNGYQNTAFDKLIKSENEVDFHGLDPSKTTFSVKALSDAVDALNKRTNQLNKFYEDSSLPKFLSNQWDQIEGDLCQLLLCLAKLFSLILEEKFGDDQSIFKFIFSYRELYDFFMRLKEQNQKNKNISQASKSAEDEITSEEFSPFKLFINVILDWISRIGEQMNVWVTKAVSLDTFEIDDKKLKTSSSPKDMFEVFRQSFNFLNSLHWDDPSIEVFVSTFLSLCGSCLRSFIETLTLKMLSYFPLEVIQESEIEAISHYIDYLQQNPNQEENKITTRSIFIIINDFMHLRAMWNQFLVNAKKLFPQMFPEEESKGKNQRISLASSNDSSSLFSSTNIVALPSHVMDPVPKITGITNSIPTLFSLVTSHLVNDTVTPHLWIKNTAVKQIFVKNASKYILNEEFFKTGSPIYANIYDTILNYIKERIDDINAAICMKYYKSMIISFLFGLDSGMMNLLVLKKKKGGAIKHKRLTPILDFIQNIYKEVYQYISETSIENVFDNEEEIIKYTPYSDFMFKHVQDDPEQLIETVTKTCPPEVINASNEKDPQFLNALCIYIIVASQNNDKRHSVINWVKENKPHFKKRRFYPPKFK